ncbi:MAG: pyrroloquinoline quinone-dependent dehydrogenase [Pseudomonadales bacterium]|nr:pyrroloquinoline quinone-dependent dehydrogenase [Pseudomonadales bacterium]
MLLGVAIILSSALATGAGWPSYGGDAGGQRYSEADQITPDNVESLSIAWQYQTGDMKSRPEAVKQSAMEVTPVLVEDSLIFCSPFNEVIALHPGTGTEKWRFDPQISLEQYPANQYICRGVSYWQNDSAADVDTCAGTIFMGTNDRRLIALDSRTGKRCPAFGDNGEVTINPGMRLAWPGEFQITSPPAIADGKVIVGSAISDNLRADAPRGIVRAFDAVSGELVWTFDPIQKTMASDWQKDSAQTTGHANVWAPMSVDAANHLVFLPTSSPSPDFYGGNRPGDNRYANSLVALDTRSGEVVWHYQTIHHDIFDYDLPAQPTLTTLMRDGKPVPAVIQATKTGLLFAFNRLTGEPLFDIEERPVPATDVPGEVSSPTQPVPVKPAPLTSWSITEDDMWGMLVFDRLSCKKRFRTLRNEGIFTPPSLRGTVELPFTGGGVNWGGIAIDPQSGVVLANTSNAIHIISLLPAADFEAERKKYPDVEISEQIGTAYAMKRDIMLSPLGVPCNAPPWGQLSAVDMNSGEILWQSTLGTTEDIAPLGISLETGTPNMGGPVVTKSGLVFIGAAMDNYLRAFDLRTGAELFKGRLPAGGQATPMSYIWEGRQYVVIAAGGHSRMGTTLGDAIVAFALPD